jgi:hypothetical protein
LQGNRRRALPIWYDRRSQDLSDLIVIFRETLQVLFHAGNLLAIPSQLELGGNQLPQQDLIVLEIWKTLLVLFDPNSLPGLKTEFHIRGYQLCQLPFSFRSVV